MVAVGFACPLQNFPKLFLPKTQMLCQEERVKKNALENSVAARTRVATFATTA
jgi:hypothetical protein